ncbi:MAG: hypothetical protein PHC52_00555 [Syntrophales bacterium]|nr:hypothetical protein [Syntrophales bacterium]
MGLHPNFNEYMLAWERDAIKGTPTVSQIKQAWVENRFAMVVYLAGLKRGMSDGYDAVKAYWDGKLRESKTYGPAEADGTWYLNELQNQSWWAFKDSIPTSLRPATEYWNKGKLWEGLYLAGVRRGWMTIREYIFKNFQQRWVQNNGFPD